MIPLGIFIFFVTFVFYRVYSISAFSGDDDLLCINQIDSNYLITWKRPHEFQWYIYYYMIK